MVGGTCVRMGHRPLAISNGISNTPTPNNKYTKEKSMLKESIADKLSIWDPLVLVRVRVIHSHSQLYCLGNLWKIAGDNRNGKYALTNFNVICCTIICCQLPIAVVVVVVDSSGVGVTSNVSLVAILSTVFTFAFYATADATHRLPKTPIEWHRNEGYYGATEVNLSSDIRFLLSAFQSWWRWYFSFFLEGWRPWDDIQLTNHKYWEDAIIFFINTL